MAVWMLLFAWERMRAAIDHDKATRFTAGNSRGGRRIGTLRRAVAVLALIVALTAPCCALDWASLPRTVNLRSELERLNVNFIQQGERNSCAAFSAVSVLEFQLRRLGCDVDLSEQYVLWAAKDVGANPAMGLSIPHLREGLEKHGVCREELMPYRRSDKIVRPSIRAQEDAARMPEIRLNYIVPFEGRFGFRDDQIFTVCKALSRQEPVCFASRWSESDKLLERGTVVDDGPMTVNHMVTLIGYELNPDNPVDGHFLIRNSWGLGWGEFGYGKLPFSFVRRHALDALQFRFVWKEDTEPTQQAEVAGASVGPVQFAAVWFLLYATAAYIGFYIPFRLFARDNGSARGVLMYTLRIAPLLLASTLMVASAASAVINGRPVVLFALCGAMIALVVVYLRITMRHFGVGFWRVVGLLLVAGLIRNSLGFLEDRWNPFDWYRPWERVFASVPLRDKPMLFTLGKEDQARLLAGQTVMWTPGGWDTEQERAWFDQWEGELRRERSRMQDALPLAKPFFARRYAAYEAQRRAFERRSAAEGDGIGTSSRASQSTDAGRKLWRMYEALCKERESLDWNDPVAVKRFNERAEQYRLHKESIEGKRSTSSG